MTDDDERADLLLKLMREGGVTHEADANALTITHHLTDRAADEVRAVARRKGWTLDKTLRWVLDMKNFEALFARLKRDMQPPGRA